jgi:levanase
VIRYTDPATGESYWVMVAVEALQYQVVLYRSDDLKTWTHLSDFGPANATGGIWECPDLFPLAVDGDPANTKWVLVVTSTPGRSRAGSGGQYFVGEFDGTTFTSESTVSDAALPPGDVVAGFDGGTYEGWTVANEPGNWRNGPWTDAPAAGTLPGQNPVSGFIGAGLVNGFADGDWPVGTLASPTFTIDRPYVNLLVGGGSHPHVDGTQLGNEPPAGRLLFDGFELPDGTTLADSGWDVTGDFATEPWRNPSTAGGDYYLGQKRLNTWEGGPKGDDNLGDLTSPAFTIQPGRGPPELPRRRRQAVQRHARGAPGRRRRGRSHGHGSGGGPAQLAVVGRRGVRGPRRALPGARRRTGGWGHLTVDHLVLGAEPAQARSEETSVSLVVDGEGRAHGDRAQQREPRLGELGRRGVRRP